MKTLPRTLAFAALSAWAVLAAAQQPRVPPRYKAAPSEIAQLPKYCYAQYVDGSLTGPEYSIPSDLCGYEMNHFCPALVFLVQAMQPSRSTVERQGAANSAINEINYTIRGMKPGCYIEADVQFALKRAREVALTIK